MLRDFALHNVRRLLEEASSMVAEVTVHRRGKRAPTGHERFRGRGLEDRSSPEPIAQVARRGRRLSLAPFS